MKKVVVWTVNVVLSVPIAVVVFLVHGCLAPLGFAGKYLDDRDDGHSRLRSLAGAAWYAVTLPFVGTWLFMRIGYDD